MSSLSLVHEANALLDEIDEKGADPFALERLEEIRAQMLLAGFASPFSAVLAQTKSEADGWTAEEAADVRKQIGNMRYLAQLKKFTLNRIRCAISSGRIARGLEQFGMQEELKLLPLGGSYRKMLLESHPVAVECYHALMDRFAVHAFEAEGASAKIQIGGEGENPQIALEFSSELEARDKVLEFFGPEAKIADLKTKKKTVGLIRSYSGKVALFTAASIRAAKIAEEEMKKKKMDGKVAEYNAILAKYRIYSDAAITEVGGLEAVKKEAAKAGFLKADFGDYEFADEELAEALAARRRARKKIALKAAGEFVFRLLVKFYVMLNENGRKAWGLPAAVMSPDERQLAVLAHIAPEGYAIKHAPKVLAEKVEFEKNEVPLEACIWGPAFVCARCGLGAAWAAGEFGGEEGEIENAIATINALVEKPAGRAAKFLLGVKKAKKEE